MHVSIMQQPLQLVLIGLVWELYQHCHGIVQWRSTDAVTLRQHHQQGGQERHPKLADEHPAWVQMHVAVARTMQ